MQDYVASAIILFAAHGETHPERSVAILEIEVSKHLFAACTTCTTVLLVVPILTDPIPRVSVWQLALLASIAFPGKEIEGSVKATFDGSDGFLISLSFFNRYEYGLVKTVGQLYQQESIY